jgi:hypothetical protein
MAKPVPRWRFFDITVAGKDPVRGKPKFPCEDRTASWTSTDGWTMLAVADGLGSAKQAAAASMALITSVVSLSLRGVVKMDDSSGKAASESIARLFAAAADEARSIAASSGAPGEFQSTFAVVGISPSDVVAWSSIGDSFIGIEYVDRRQIAEYSGVGGKSSPSDPAEDYSSRSLLCVLYPERAQGDPTVESAFNVGATARRCSLQGTGVRGVAVFTDGLEAFVEESRYDQSSLPRNLEPKLFGGAFGFLRNEEYSRLVNGFWNLKTQKRDDIGIALATRV